MMNCQQRIREIVMACLGLVMMVSCGYWGERIYHEHSKSVSAGWTQKDTVSFALSLFPKGRDVKVSVEVCYTDDYRYRNLWLLLRHNVEDSLHWQTDTLCCPLYDDAGHSLGTGLTGLYQVEVPFRILQPDGSSSACMQIMHCMAADSLKGISDVGVKAASVVE